MASSPEWTFGPALLLSVVLAQGLAVGGEVMLKHQVVSFEPTRVAATKPIGNCIGCEHAGTHRLQNALTRHRIVAQGGVPHAEQRGSGIGAAAAGTRRKHDRTALT